MRTYSEEKRNGHFDNKPTLPGGKANQDFSLPRLGRPSISKSSNWEAAEATAFDLMP